MDKHVFDFDQQFEKQKEYLEMFISWLKRRGCKDITDATPDEQRRSIDLSYTANGSKHTVEVKTDFRAWKTGNMVFEVVSQARVGANSDLGWGFKVWNAQELAYIIPYTKRVVAHFYYPDRLQEWVLEHYGDLRNFAAVNPTYTTLGVLLPLNWVEEVRHQTAVLSGVQQPTLF